MHISSVSWDFGEGGTKIHCFSGFVDYIKQLPLSGVILYFLIVKQHFSKQVFVWDYFKQRIDTYLGI